MHGSGDVALVKNDGSQGVQIRRHDDQRHLEVFKVHAAQGLFQMTADLVPPDQTFRRRKQRVEQPQQSPAVLDFASQFFEFLAINARRPERPDVGPHAGP